MAEAASEKKQDAKASQAAFLEAYKVFMHPRCMNCHPDGDAPLQGDDSHVHAQNVRRGPDGKGLYALKCANCHQDANLPGEHMPPGNPNWHLLPPETPMVFQGRSPRELAEQLVDPKRNGGKSLEQLLHHVSKDPLVMWGWNPGDGRTKPPLTHDEFAAAMRTWIENGAVAPE
jgi:mono/diheme cytochrome c family protein